MEDYDVPKDILFYHCGHSEDISKKHHNNTQYLKNLEVMVSDLHDSDRLLKSYVSTKRTRTKRTTDNKEQSEDEESSVA